MKNLIACFVTMHLFLFATAQIEPADFAKMSDVVPPPPNAASIEKAGLASLNKNTGAPSVNIPLYSVSGQKLSTAISLSYGSSGIKVDDVSGRAGMGWALNAGGVVSRTQRGARDEASTRLAIYSPFGYNCGSLDFLERAADNSSGYDAEPDLFSFNMDGHSGSFVFDAGMNPVTSDQSKYKIEKNFTSTDWNFRITTPDGIRYLFGGTGARERSKRTTSCGKSYDTYVYNAWYLKTIEHPNGEKIHFTYSSHTYAYDNGVTETLTWAQTCGSPSYAPKCVNIMETEGCLLSSVYNDYTSVSFSYQNRTYSTEDKLVSSISIYDLAAPSTARGSFSFSYTATTGQSSYDYKAYSGQDKTYYLTGLTQYSESSQYNRPYAFSYITPGQRPYRASYAQDHWGYFNGQDNATLIPLPDDLTLQSRFPGATANREASATHAQMGMLQTISFPTGGSQEFEYELNKYYNTGTSSHLDAGGVRVKKIVTKNTGHPDIVKKYYYGDISTLTQSSLVERYAPSYIKNYNVKIDDNGGSYYNCSHIGMYSNSLINAVSYHSAPTSYASVVEGYGDDFEAGAIQTKFIASYDATASLVQGADIQGAPLTNSSNAYNGKVEEEIVYKKGGSGLFPIKKTSYEYYLDTRAQDLVNGYRVFKNFSYPSWPSCPTDNSYALQAENYDVMKYEFRSYWVYLQEKTETVYDEDGSNAKVQVTTYTYADADHRQLTGTGTTESDGTTVTATYKYPKDYLPGTVYSDMISANMISPVIKYKQTKTGSNVPIIEVETPYKEEATDNFVPAEVKKATQSLSLASEGTFDLYDSKGNLLQYTDKSGLKHAIIWGYDHLYPVAKISGATYSAAKATLTGGDTVALQSMDGNTLLTELNRIRTGLSSAFVTTYTYKHLAGITAVVDANNKRNVYEYDKFNRLVQIRDQDGFIVKKICYNYYGQTEDCSTACTYTDPIWKNTSTALRCETATDCSFTGYQEQEQMDMNPCSGSYTDTRWVKAGYNLAACGTSTMVQVSAVNPGFPGYRVYYYNTSSSLGQPIPFDVPTNGGVLGCIPAGRYDVYIFKPGAGLPIVMEFSINGTTVTDTEANFYNINMSFSANRVITISNAY